MALTILESVVKFIFKMGKTQTELSEVKKLFCFLKISESLNNHQNVSFSLQFLTYQFCHFFSNFGDMYLQIAQILTKASDYCDSTCQNYI